MNEPDYATRQDIQRLEGRIDGLERQVGDMAQNVGQVKDQLLEAMRQLSERFERAETTLLSGFHTQMRSQETRLGRFRVDLSNMDHEYEVRLEAVEERLRALEERLPPKL
jgi:polyhydroxyalkanoate synthesis regulator phasin